ncbi:MAG: aldo/keto reductase [Eubacteriales bacterium]|nr:aldo/keto reductase [Eubacteriales bacterium]
MMKYTSLDSISAGITLSNGVLIPALGFGTYQMPNDMTAVEAIEQALACGYRHIDTAAFYKNEESVARAIEKSDLSRDEIFITSKLWNNIRGYEETVEAFNDSLDRLNTDYLDLYLIHWPRPVYFKDNWAEKNADTWRAMEDLYREGRVRAIGVSNFLEHHIVALEERSEIRPMVNQIHLCPGLLPQELLRFCDERDILIQSYMPIARGLVIEVPELQSMAAELGKTVPQVVLRWHLQHGFSPLPKSVTPKYIRENASLFDFSLTTEQMQIIDDLTPGICGKAKDPDSIDF